MTKHTAPESVNAGFDGALEAGITLLGKLEYLADSGFSHLPTKEIEELDETVPFIQRSFGNVNRIKLLCKDLKDNSGNLSAGEAFDRLDELLLEAVLTATKIRHAASMQSAKLCAQWNMEGNLDNASEHAG